MKGTATPVKQEIGAVRTQDLIELFDKAIHSSDGTYNSESFVCAPFRKFSLYVRLDSTGAPTLIHVKVQFLNRWDNEWYTYKQGLFAALFWEDADTASGIRESFNGDVQGRQMRVQLTVTGTSSTKYWKTSIAVDLRD